MPVRVIHTKLLFWVVMGLFILGAYSCSEPASPFGQTEITLEALDASCTEVWLELKFSNLTQPADVQIQKDGKDYHRILSLNRDTLLAFEDLEPSTNYSFRAIIRHEGKDDKTSNTAPIRTMDTTSHSFTWQSWNFGTGAGTSRLNDIVVINKNNIWAVGFIKIDGVEYNAIHWNGIEWTLKQIPFTYNGITSINEIYSAYSLSDSTVIFAIGVLIILQNSSFTQLFPPEDLFPSRVNKLYASSLEDIYIVGNYGLIAHYNGKSWRKIETSAFAQTMRVRDIWSNPEVNYLYAVASSFPAANSTVIIKINKETLQVEELIPQNGNRSVVSCWFHNERKTFFAGGGFYTTISLDQTWKSIPYEFPSYKWRMRGISDNEIYMCDDFGYLTYYNGIRTRDINYENLNGSVLSLDAKDGIVGIVGISSNRAIVSLIKIQE